MALANRIEAFFKAFELAWEAVPSTVKVFFFSVVSSTFGLWVADSLTLESVVIIVATNLGIYKAPRIVAEQTRKLL